MLHSIKVEKVLLFDKQTIIYTGVYDLPMQNRSGDTVWYCGLLKVTLTSVFLSLSLVPTISFFWAEGSGQEYLHIVCRQSPDHTTGSPPRGLQKGMCRTWFRGNSYAKSIVSEAHMKLNSNMSKSAQEF